MESGGLEPVNQNNEDPSDKAMRRLRHWVRLMDYEESRRRAPRRWGMLLGALICLLSVALVVIWGWAYYSKSLG
jgi:hypothetical protein